MPKLIDYPRTSYAGAWEVADVVDDTGGKCALDTCARKLNRKVSGSFKAIVGSAVKFGLLTSKRELLTTTTLFRRIKHAYDKQEELLFHREAFLTPPLFTQLCRKFRSRELPVQMLDIMLIREFDVEEINAQSVAKAFVDGARMVGLLDERNIIADIDQLAAQQPPRRELASPELGANSFRAEISRATTAATTATSGSGITAAGSPDAGETPIPPPIATPLRGRDAVASLFGLADDANTRPAESAATSAAVRNPAEPVAPTAPPPRPPLSPSAATGAVPPASPALTAPGEAAPPGPAPAKPARAGRSADSAGLALANPVETPGAGEAAQTPAPTPSGVGNVSSGRQPIQPSVAATPLSPGGFRIELSGPGLNTVLDVQDEDDLALARVLLDKIGRQLKK